MKAWLMYVYHGHLKIRHGKIVYTCRGSFLPDDKPNGPLMCQMPIDRVKNDYTVVPAFNKYQFGKVLIKNEEDIPKWKEFFKQLYSDKLKSSEAGYKHELWSNLIKECE